jgi:hypothetical protein
MPNYHRRCLVPYCESTTGRRYFCDTHHKHHERTGDYDNLVRQADADSCWTTPIKYHPYKKRVQELARQLPVDKATKRKFVAVMATAYRKELDK